MIWWSLPPGVLIPCLPIRQPSFPHLEGCVVIAPRCFEPQPAHKTAKFHSLGSVCLWLCCGSVGLWLCVSVALWWVCGSVVGLWLCGTMALWLCGSLVCVGLWVCRGSVALCGFSLWVCRSRVGLWVSCAVVGLLWVSQAVWLRLQALRQADHTSPTTTPHLAPLRHDRQGDQSTCCPLGAQCAHEWAPDLRRWGPHPDSQRSSRIPTWTRSIHTLYYYICVYVVYVYTCRIYIISI